MRRLPWVFAVALGSTFTLAFEYDGTPRGHAFGYGETAGIIQQRIFEQWRPTSVVPETPGSLTTKFRVAYVKDASISPATLKFAFDKSPAEINSLRGQGWRIEDLVVIRGGAEPRLAAMLRKYASPQAETFWFWNYDQAQVDALCQAGNRILDLDLDGVVGGEQRFAGVMVKNTGAHHKAWGWMPGHSPKEINDWANQNGMRLIDFLERPNGKYAAVFVKWDPAGGRSEHFILTANQIPEVMGARGMKLQTLNSRPGSQWFTGVFVNNVNAQSARIADRLAGATGGEIGAYVTQVGGPVIVNLRGDRKFYPCSAIKVLIHAYGMSKVAANELMTYKVKGEYFSTLSRTMMQDSNNESTWKLNEHWGHDKINAYGKSVLGLSDMSYIKWHYGQAPPDGDYNAWANLVDMASLYAKIGAVGGSKMPKLIEWMLNNTNSGMFDGEYGAAKAKLGLTNAQYSAWKNNVKFYFKAGSLPHANGGGDSDFVVLGKITLPHKAGTMAVLKSYTYGYFVNKAPQPYKSPVNWEIAAMLMREQIEDSMRTYK